MNNPRLWTALQLLPACILLILILFTAIDYAVGQPLTWESFEHNVLLALPGVAAFIGAAMILDANSGAGEEDDHEQP